MRCVRLALVCLCLAAAPAAAAPTHGLLWSQSELPLVFPLQVRTAPGRDAYLVLTEVQSGRDVLAAYAEGGRFFRVLVPPGTFRVHVALGRGWQDETALFGPETETYAHPDALEFGVSGVGRKSGHLLDLRGMGEGVEASARDLSLCQHRTLDADAFGGALPENAARPDALDERSAPDVLEGDPYFRRTYRYEFRERLCG